MFSIDLECCLGQNARKTLGIPFSLLAMLAMHALRLSQNGPQILEMAGTPNFGPWLSLVRNAIGRRIVVISTPSNVLPIFGRGAACLNGRRRYSSKASSRAKPIHQSRV